jgi:ATP-dependent Clp protease ATP-binding subunit ClpX
VTLDPLGREEMLRILQEPKNALVKQYIKLFGYDDVELEFEPAALERIAELTVEKKTGARGLRSIIEKTLMNTMFEMPSDETILKCIVTKESAEGTEQPSLLVSDGGQKNHGSSKYKAGKEE